MTQYVTCAYSPRQGIAVNAWRLTSIRAEHTATGWRIATLWHGWHTAASMVAGEEPLPGAVLEKVYEVNDSMSIYADWTQLLHVLHQDLVQWIEEQCISARIDTLKNGREK